MSWIESHTELRNHPKTNRLMRLLGVSRAQAIGHLHLLWYWCWDYAPDGDLSRWEHLDIATGAEWEGDEDPFVEALTTAGFLKVGDGGGLVVNDWMKFTGKQRKEMDARAAHMRDVRASKKPPKPRDPHVRVTSPSRDPDVIANQTGPDRTGPNRTKPVPVSLPVSTSDRNAREEPADSDPIPRHNGLDPESSTRVAEDEDAGLEGGVLDTTRMLVEARLLPYSREFEDDRLTASVTRTIGTMERFGLEQWEIDNAMKLAHRQTQKRLDDFKQPPIASKMAYFLGVLEHCAAERAAAHAAAAS